ncbi:fasciclin domain-containing protein [Spirosoma montaniterrae]|uniref:FAS1 domain-containing protein n=1 Tax=Spirosoma montaniterrae TaxID=1178516 RepID=A0A1P9WXG8_9BACT|nr:fasciclin domain-containing protein [Spirosoma montaniterrae]AQG80008.1 hypothetical protein AWR27_12120 [Spirosoma montaniterrae]
MKLRLYFVQFAAYLLVAILFTATGCERALQPVEPVRASGARVRVNQTITELVVNNPNFSLLRDAVVRAGLADALASGDLTVFAPTNAAFEQAGLDANAISGADLNTLRNILLYHVIGNGRFFEEGIQPFLNGLTTLQGQQVQVVRRDGFSVNGNLVSTPDIETRNGVVHVIDNVLMPPSASTVELALANPNLTYLVAALQRLNQANPTLLNQLQSGEFTVFAPTNEAFQRAGFTTIDAVRTANTDFLSRVLTYHVIAGRRFTTQFNDGRVMTNQGNAITLTQWPGRSTVQGLGNAMPTTILMPNILTTTGVVHVINDVLLPDARPLVSITNLVVGNPEFSLLRTAVVRAGLADALASGNLTVFAPTNAAFRRAGFADENAINNADLNTLRNILLYHVIGGQRYETSNFNELLIGFTTLQGQQVQVTRRQGVSVNGAFVVQSNVFATNGIVHVIDNVLMPPMGTIVDAAVGNPNLTYLVAAVQRAGLASTLASNGPFTVFAPTNAAFQEAGFATIDAVRNADPAVLTRILLYHVTDNRTFESMLRGGELLTLGGVLNVSAASGVRPTVRGRGNSRASNIVAGNVVTTNGVVHVIDHVLLP